MGDYNDEKHRGFYGIGGGSSYGFQEGQRDRANDDAKWNGAPPAHNSGQSDGDGSGIVLLLGLVAVGAGIWTFRYLLALVLVSMVATACALWLVARLNKRGIGALEAAKQSVIATFIAIGTAIVLVGGAAALVMLGGPELLPVGEIASDHWWQADVVAGNLLSALAIPALLMLAASVWWLDRRQLDDGAAKAKRRLQLAAAMLAGPVVAAGVAGLLG